MTSILKLFRDILCKLRPTRSSIHSFFRRWALFLALLGRKLGLRDDRKRGTFPKAGQAERSPPAKETSLDSREYVVVRVAASSIPMSANHPNVRNESSAPPRTTPSSDRDDANPSSGLDARIESNRRSTDSSIRSRIDNRPSITHSRESLHTPVSPTTHRFGSTSSVSPSRGSPRSSSTTHRGPQLPPYETDVTNPHPQTQVDSRNGPTNLPSVISHPDKQLSPAGIRGLHRRPSSKSVVIGVVNPSTKSHPLSPSTQPPLTDEPYIIGSPIDHSSTVAGAPDVPEGSPQHGPTISRSGFVTSNIDLPAGRFLKLIVSEEVPRYTKDVTVHRERHHYEIPPLTTTFLHVPERMSPEQGSLENCAPWVPATHPDGALYFFDQDRRLFTDTNMHDLVLREEMEDFYLYLQRILSFDDLVLPSKNYDLALDIMPSEDGRIQWSYYYACHESRCLFWLDAYNANRLISELFGVKSPALVKHRLEDLYWTHWSLFPTVFKGRRLRHEVVDELVGMLSHGIMDVLTSKHSTLPYDTDTMQMMLAVARNAKESDVGLVYHTVGVTRILSFFAHWRFLYFHGQNNARLQRHLTAYADARQKRSLLITSLSPALFLAPEGYLRELENVWVDEIIIDATWRNFISGLLKEWEQLILASTVMLLVNVGFLAIPGVVISNLNTNITNTNQVDIFTSPAQIASCMSIVAGAGSIMIGLLLIRHSGPKQNEDPAGAAIYLYQNTHQKYGLEPLAIIYGLPWALLMWAMVMFSIALLLFCFLISNLSTRIFVAVTSVIVVALTGWCIRNASGPSDARGAWSNGLRLQVAHALDYVRGTRNNLFAPIRRRENPSSLAYGHSIGSRSIHDRESGGVV